MRRILMTLIEFAIMIAVFAVCDKPGIMKYAAAISVSLGFMFLGKCKKWSIKPLICIMLPVSTYLIVGCTNSLIRGNIYSETMKIILFWIVPLMFGFSMYLFYGENVSHIVDIQFASCALIYLVSKARFIIESHNSESMFAYAYGAFLVYYTYKKRWGLCALAIPLMLLADKRIVFVAVLAAIFVQGLLWLFRNDKRLAQGIWVLTIFVSNAYLWLICSGVFEGFCKGVGINTNGRAKIFGQTVEWFDNKFILIGQGIGIVEKLLSAWNIEKFANLHNDLLKFHIELGFVGLLLYFVSYGIGFYLIEKKFGKRKLSLFISMAIYTMILFATDNVSIYIIFLIPLYSIYFAVLADNKTEVIEERI